MSVPYFNTNDFGEIISIAGTDVNGIWSLAYAEDGMMSGNKPEFLCRDADTTHVSIGSTATREGQDYKVVRKEPDGTGFLILHMEKI